MSICYIEIPAPKFEETKAFYAKAFGWKITDTTIQDVPYAMFNTEESEKGLTAGGFAPTLKPIENGSLNIYLLVDDIDKKLELIENLGGKTILEKTKIGDDYGFYATFRDPSKNHIHIWSQS